MVRRSTDFAPPSRAAPNATHTWPETTRTTRLVVLIALTLAGAAGLAWPAFHNGYPLTFQDSAWYMSLATGSAPHPGRAIGYPLLVAGALVWPSLWSVIAVQALITAAALVRVTDRVAGGGARGLAWAAAALVCVVTLTNLPRYASWVMADITTGWLFLAGMLWMWSAGRVDRVAAMLLGAFAVASHHSHPPLALGMAAAVWAAATCLWPARHATRRAARHLGFATLAAVAAIPLLHAAVGEAPTWFRGGSSFLMYRLIDSGVAVETLDAYCPERDWVSCEHRDEFARHVGRADGWFLFDPESPFFTALGGWRGEEPGEIVAHAWRCCAPSLIAATVHGAWEQFWRVDSRDGLAPRDTRPIRAWLRAQRHPEFPAARRSRQATGAPDAWVVHPFPERAWHGAFVITALACAGWALARGRPRLAALPAAALLLLVGNAFVCALGSSLHDRYQGRLTWLLPFALLLTAALWREAGARGDREPEEAGLTLRRPPPRAPRP